MRRSNAKTSRGVFYRYKRGLLAVVVFLLALGVMRVSWASSSRRALLLATKRLQDQNLPFSVQPEPEIAPSVAEAQKLLQAVRDDLRLTRLQRQFVQNISRISRVSPADNALLADVSARTDTLRLTVRRARLLADGAWPLRARNAAIDDRRALDDMVAAEFRVIQMLCAVALHQHRSGDDSTAVETLLDAQSLAVYLGELPERRSHGWAHLASRWVVYYLEEISRDLCVAGFAHSAKPGHRPASRDQINSLIAQLVDDRTFNRQVRQMVQFDRMRVLVRVQQVLDGQLGLSELRYSTFDEPGRLEAYELALFLPMYRFDAARVIECSAAAVEAAGLSTWAQVRRDLPSLPRYERGTLTRFCHPFSARLRLDLEPYLKQRFRTLAMRHMAAAALAIRLYELEYDYLPDTLDELVPKFINAIPGDPLAEDRRPVSYALKTDPPILYSVGFNGRDEHGALPDDFSVANHWEMRDLPVFFNGNRPWGKRR